MEDLAATLDNKDHVPSATKEFHHRGEMEDLASTKDHVPSATKEFHHRGEIEDLASTRGGSTLGAKESSLGAKDSSPSLRRVGGDHHAENLEQVMQVNRSAPLDGCGSSSAGSRASRRTTNSSTASGRQAQKLIPAWIMRRGRAEMWLLKSSDLVLSEGPPDVSDGGGTVNALAMAAVAAQSFADMRSACAAATSRLALPSRPGRIKSDSSGSDIIVHSFQGDMLIDGDLGRFEAAAEMLSQLRQIEHPNLLRFFGIVLPGSAPSSGGSVIWSVVVERVDGLSLRNYMSGKEKNEPRLRLAIDIALGLQYLHSQHSPIAHGDLSPETVVVVRTLRSPGAAAKLGDFVMDAIHPRPGRRPYVAPEVRAVMFAGLQKSFDVGAGTGASRYPRTSKVAHYPRDQKLKLLRTTIADIYSFGLLLLFIITNCDPPSSSSARIRDVEEADPALVWALEVRPCLASCMLSFLDLCLQTQPARRAQAISTAIIWDQLVTALSEQEQTAGNVAVSSSDSGQDFESSEDLSSFERGCLARLTSATQRPLNFDFGFETEEENSGGHEMPEADSGVVPCQASASTAAFVASASTGALMGPAGGSGSGRHGTRHGSMPDGSGAAVNRCQTAPAALVGPAGGSGSGGTPDGSRRLRSSSEDKFIVAL